MTSRGVVMDTSISIGAELLAEAKSVLHGNESMSAFVEQSVQLGILHPRLRLEFVDRGLATTADSEQTEEYVDADEVLRELDEMLISKEQAGDR